MSNTDSSGGIGGRVGRSMDYSQLLEIRRKFVNVQNMHHVNEYAVTNSISPTQIKPWFNQDKKNREPGSNGAVDFFMTRGLYSLRTQVFTSK